MITEKTRISKDFPIKISFHFKKSDWYLFPQGYTSMGTMTKMRYCSEKSGNGVNTYEHDAYWVINTYWFNWLFFVIMFKTNLIHAGGRPEFIIENKWKEPAKDKEIPLKLQHN